MSRGRPVPLLHAPNHYLACMQGTQSGHVSHNENFRHQVRNQFINAILIGPEFPLANGVDILL